MFDANQIKEWIKERDNGDSAAQSKIDEMMKLLPKAKSNTNHHEVSELHAKWF